MYLIRCGTFVCGLVPRSLARRIALVLADACGLLLPARRRTVTLNLCRTARDRNPAERRRLCRSTFRNFGLCLVDFLGMLRMNREQLLDLIQLRGLENLEQALGEGKGVIIITPHLGNWELAGVFLGTLGFPAHAVAEYIGPEINALYDRYRGMTGLRIVPLGAAGRSALEVLRRGEVLVLVGDRAIGSHGLPVEFAGGRRDLPKGPARLALASGATLLVGYLALSADPGGRSYIGVVEEKIPTAGLGSDAVSELTSRIAQRLGSVVSRYPDQWFVFQPGWRDPA